MTAIYWPDFPTFTHPLPFDAFSERDPFELHVRYGRTRMAGLQSGVGRMMIDSVVWAQYINVTDTQTDKQTRRLSKCRANVLRRAAKMLYGAKDGSVVFSSAG